MFPKLWSILDLRFVEFGDVNFWPLYFKTALPITCGTAKISNFLQIRSCCDLMFLTYKAKGHGTDRRTDERA